jgi:formylglycine-generating enzyme required for sulfatase activity/dienelactone hydrolase
VRWAREVLLPEIERQIQENDVWRNLVPPYRLAEQAEGVLPGDPKLNALFERCSLKLNITTDPPGATVSYKEYATPDAQWMSLGVTPIQQIRLPIGIFRWKFEKEGYETVLAAASTWRAGGGSITTSGIPNAYNLSRTLDKKGSVPAGMVRVPATDAAVGKLDDFFIGRYEVTNREYKAFVDAGGYRNREYWTHPFVKEARKLSWEEVIREFVDPSGQPGPSTWLGGDYPEGKADHPVSGVSWYEAAAYAEYAGMSLPTSAHWNVARGAFTPMIQTPQLGGFAVLAPFANFGRQGTVPVGSLPSVTAYGAYDMPGNVREWCWNETQAGRVMRGGSWEDNTYEFGNVRQAPAMDRSPRNGFRLAFYPHPEKIPETVFAAQKLGTSSDFRAQKPVPDDIFEVYTQQFAYDKTPLNARVDSREKSPGGWTREKVSFDAAYGGERIFAYLFLPANAQPPYQTVIYFPGSATTRTASSQDLESYYEFPMFVSFLVKNGRAVLFPVYKGTFERGTPALASIHAGAETHAYTEFLVQLVKDVRRSIDYLETRTDVASGKLVFQGMSWGGWLGSIIPAVEERFAAAVLVAGGLGMNPARPEASTLNYVTRIKMPTLMLNGKYDNGIDRRIKPMFDLLGTPAGHKRLILYDTDHVPPVSEFIKETLAWLEKYQGPVKR